MRRIGECKCKGKIIQIGNGNIFCEDCEDKDFGKRLQNIVNIKRRRSKDSLS